jgi:hypothetical protein
LRTVIVKKTTQSNRKTKDKRKITTERKNKIEATDKKDRKPANPAKTLRLANGPDGHRKAFENRPNGPKCRSKSNPLVSIVDSDKDALGDGKARESVSGDKDERRKNAENFDLRVAEEGKDAGKGKSTDEEAEYRAETNPISSVLHVNRSFFKCRNKTEKETNMRPAQAFASSC